MPHSSQRPFVEHINATVQDIDRALHFITTALPEWRVRGGGTLAWYGKTIRWLHVGDDAHYIALQSGGHFIVGIELVDRVVRQNSNPQSSSSGMRGAFGSEGLARL